MDPTERQPSRDVSITRCMEVSCILFIVYLTTISTAYVLLMFSKKGVSRLKLFLI
jgi:hypothetical protein